MADEKWLVFDAQTEAPLVGEHASGVRRHASCGPQRPLRNGRVLLYQGSTERSPHEKESRMQHVTSSRRSVGVFAAHLMFAVVAPAYAQTRGMDHRDDRRDDRSAGQAAKQDCKAGDEKSRAE